MEEPHKQTAAEEERSYGEAWAERYDDIFRNVDQSCLDFLESLLGPDRRALELAVGTGRVALPLAERSITVTGVDVSPSMLARLVAKSGANVVTVVEGDMVDIPADGLFPLVFIAANSIFAISSQDRQVECFANVAKHLESGGRFVLECFVPDMKRFDDEHHHESERTLEQFGSIHAEVSTHEPETQRVHSQITTRTSDGAEATLPVSIRYAWPSELDLMARLAGLRLEERFEWYDRSSFTADSPRHVSVYRKP